MILLHVSTNQNKTLINSTQIYDYKNLRIQPSSARGVVRALGAWAVGVGRIARIVGDVLTYRN